MRISALLRQAQEDPRQQAKTLLTNTNYVWKELGNVLSPSSSRSIAPHDLTRALDPKAIKALGELQDKLKEAYEAAYQAMRQLAQIKAS